MRFDIAAQPLEQAIDDFIAVTDWQVGFPSSLTNNIASSGVSGAYTPGEALGMLLAGTGLAYRFTAKEAVALELVTPRANGDAINLGPIEVEGARSTGYKAEVGSTATKTSTPIKDTPFSISVVTKEVIEDQSADTLGEVLKNVPGVNKKGRILGDYEDFSLRGFGQNLFQSFLLDGKTFFYHAMPTVATLERVEVIRGPSSVLYGRAEPGGQINLVTKKPTPYFFAEGTAGYGSWDHRRAFFDVSGPVYESETLGLFSARLNVGREDSNSFRDQVDFEYNVFDVEFQWDFSERGNVRLHYDYLDRDQTFDTGLVVIGDEVVDLPRSTFLNQPWGRYDSIGENAGVDIEYEVSDNWLIRSGYNYQFNNRRRVDVDPLELDEETGDITFQSVDRDQEWQFHTFVTDLIGKVNVFGMRHKLLFGVNGTHIKEDAIETDFAQAPTFPNNIFNPVFVPQPAFYPKEDGNRTRSNIYYGVYIEDQIRVVDSLDLMFGVRYDDFRDKQIIPPSSESPEVTRNESENDAFTPRTGIVFRPIKPISLYASYSQGFAPNGTADEGLNEGAQLDPTESEQYEVGAKVNWLDGRLATRVAFYDLTRTNDPFYDPLQDLTLLIGERRSRGAEFEVVGQVLPGFDVIGTYSYIDAELTRTDALDDNDISLEGNTPGQVPRHTAGLWNSYVVQGGPLANVGFGLGAFYESSRWGDDQHTFRLDEYLRFDAALSYFLELGSSVLDLRLHLENLTDERYFFATNNQRTEITVGEPFNAMFTASLRF